VVVPVFLHVSPPVGDLSLACVGRLAQLLRLGLSGCAISLEVMLDVGTRLIPRGCSAGFLLGSVERLHEFRCALALHVRSYRHRAQPAAATSRRDLRCLAIPGRFAYAALTAPTDSIAAWRIRSVLLPGSSVFRLYAAMSTMLTSSPNPAQ
jgi:hypothetical protein